VTTVNGAPSGVLSSANVLITLILGSVGLMVFGLQPLLFGSYVKEGVLTEQVLGLLGAVEVTGIAIGSGIAIPLLRKSRTAWVGLAGIMLMAAANLFQPHAGDALLLFAARAICGLGEGLTVGIASYAIAGAHRVASWTAAFQLIQAASQFVVIEGFAVLKLPTSSGTVQSTLALAAGACLLALPFLPRFSATEAGEAGVQANSPSLPGYVGLVAMFLFVGGVVGIWGYTGLWLESRGLTATQATGALAASLAGQSIGAFIGMIIGDGRRAWVRLSALIIILLGIVGAWIARPDLVALAFVFGLAWQLVTPALASVLVELDPRRRALPFAAAAQLAGIAALPTILGYAYGGGSLDMLIIAFAAPIALSLLLILTQIRGLRRLAYARSAALAGTPHELGGEHRWG
jgi:hypothetical protein